LGVEIGIVEAEALRHGALLGEWAKAGARDGRPSGG